MAERVLDGCPEQRMWGVRAGDVALALQDLEPGFHSIADVWAAYRAVTGKISGPGVTTIVSKMGLTPFTMDGERGWRIDPVRLAERWPRLPLGGVTVKCQRGNLSAGTRCPLGPVGCPA